MESISNNKREQILRKLTAYSSLAATLTGISHETKGAVIYTDIDPDSVFMQSGDAYELDINHDNTPDFKLSMYYHSNTYSYWLVSKYISIEGLNSNEVIGHFSSSMNPCSSQFSAYMADKLSSGVLIDSGQNWESGNNRLTNIFAHSLCSTNVNMGSWLGEQDQYLGLKILVNGQAYYGWARLDVAADSKSFTLKDYAYENAQGMPIPAGALSSPYPFPATSVVANDIDNFGDGRDMEIRFDKVMDENTIDHYRVMVVKSANLASFDLATAGAVPGGNYTHIAKTGVNIVDTLSAGSLDVDGDPITTGVPYKVLVLSVGDGIISTGNTLSLPSNDITLGIPADPVMNIQVADVGDTGDGRDLQVSFDKAPDENKVAGYRAVVVKSPDTLNFDMAVARQAFTNGFYKDIAKTGADISITLAASTRDIDGDTVGTAIPYKLYIITMADGINANVDVLAGPSPEITLQTISSPVDSIMAFDIGDNGDASDLQVTFDKAPDESRVKWYDIYVVKSANAGSFDKNAAYAAQDFSRAYKTGSNINYVLPWYERDTDGDNIHMGQPYKVFVLSVADGSYATIDTLSGPSNEIILTTNSPDSVKNIMPSDVANYFDGRDIKVTFDKVNDESEIGEYRLFMTTSFDAPFVDLNYANNLSPSQYKVVPKTGNNLSVQLDSTFKTGSGASIQGYTNYNIFVLSVADGVNTTSNQLSSPSPTFELTDNGSANPVTITNVQDATDFHDGRDLVVSFNKADAEEDIETYRIIVVPTANAATFTLADAEALASDRYYEAAKTGQNIMTNLDDQVKDSEGNAIVEQTAYQLFVYSVPDTFKIASGALSLPSQEIALSSVTGYRNLNKGVQAPEIFASGRSVTVRSRHSDLVPESLTIWNAMGQQVYQTYSIGAIQTIDLSHAASGMYIVQVRWKGFDVQRKVILH